VTQVKIKIKQPGAKLKVKAASLKAAVGKLRLLKKKLSSKELPDA